MSEVIHLGQGWQFRQLGTGASGHDWTPVELPHSAFEPDLDGREHWFGECEYQRQLEPLPDLAGGRCVLWLGAAMQVARVWVDDREVGTHSGGYLPCEFDLTDFLPATRSARLLIRLDNRHHPDIPPGKPYDELDFCWYGGLYREAELRLRPVVHITDAATAGEVAGGGLFLRTVSVSANEALVEVRTHVRNVGLQPTAVRVQVSMRFAGREVATSTSSVQAIPAGSGLHVEQPLRLASPRRWSPDAPQLHDVVVTVLDPEGRAFDTAQERFGVRRIAFSRSGGFVINGRRLRLRGTNRHQEYPRAGYAVPPAAQYRDALRIKQAGFDYVRLSHYPQSPHFLAACDELGIVVMNCIPGWQYLGGPRFRRAAFEAARQLIRRDRNHASVVLWELSLNETAMDDEFSGRMHAIGHEEYPGDQMVTCGWVDRYDVFIHSRQHGEIHRWHNGDKALVIAEYGDWEFFARNEGFDQKARTGMFDRWSTARQFRSDGERGLRQQAFNHLVALNDTLGSPAALDGQWAMFDYARGYDPVRAACGVMDIFRLPKFSYFLYRSQRAPDEHGTGWTGGPVVFIASHWTSVSNLRIPVFSNCERVELRLNGRLVAASRPAQTALTQHLPHPPFFFDLPKFEPGTLEATGYIGNRALGAHVVATPGAPHHLELQVDELGVRAGPDEPDLLLVHALWRDERGTLCVESVAPVTFALAGSAELLGPATLAAEAGVASTVLRLPRGASGFSATATPGATGSADAVELHWPAPSAEAGRVPAASAATQS